MSATEGGMRIASQMPQWTAERSRSKELDVRKKAETKVGGEQGGSAWCGIRKKSLFNLG